MAPTHISTPSTNCLASTNFCLCLPLLPSPASHLLPCSANLSTSKSAFYSAPSPILPTSPYHSVFLAVIPCTPSTDRSTFPTTPVLPSAPAIHTGSSLLLAYFTPKPLACSPIFSPLLGPVLLIAPDLHLPPVAQPFPTPAYASCCSGPLAFPFAPSTALFSTQNRFIAAPSPILSTLLSGSILLLLCRRLSFSPPSSASASLSPLSTATHSFPSSAPVGPFAYTSSPIWLPTPLLRRSPVAARPWSLTPASLPLPCLGCLPFLLTPLPPADHSHSWIQPHPL
jgi:hypothetical protein